MAHSLAQVSRSHSRATFVLSNPVDFLIVPRNRCTRSSSCSSGSRPAPAVRAASSAGQENSKREGSIQNDVIPVQNLPLKPQSHVHEGYRRIEIRSQAAFSTIPAGVNSKRVANQKQRLPREHLGVCKHGRVAKAVESGMAIMACSFRSMCLSFQTSATLRMYVFLLLWTTSKPLNELCLALQRARLGRIAGHLRMIYSPSILLEHKGKLPWCDMPKIATPTVEIECGVAG
ncbi:hypothetical protein KC349_g118 [Hortaea werneckii]|nr:hypothetical protein KC349_g118 [Hortaea werneckii]